MHLKQVPKFKNLALGAMLAMVCFPLLSSKVAAIVPFSLNPSGTSHIGWMFSNSTWDNKGDWHVVTGSDAHAGSDYYADDWNWGSGPDDCGMDVRAPFSGNIIYSGWSTNASGSASGYGYVVIIQASANNNFAWRAAHLQSSGLRGEGPVNAGDIIGKVGNSSGTMTFPCHLHSVLYKNIYNTTTYGTTAISRLDGFGGAVGPTSGGPDQFATPFYNDGDTGSTPPPPSGCPSVTYNGVVLYDQAQCSGGNREFGSTGFTNLPDVGWNDRARSIHVKSGWSVRVWEHGSKGGASVCFYGSKYDLSQDTYDGGAQIIQGGLPTISSIEVFQNSNCTGSTPPPSACANYTNNGVVIFNDPQCTGAWIKFTGEGTWNVGDTPGYNDEGESMYVPSGWSAKVYSDANKSGSSVCMTGTKWDMSQDRYDDGTYIVSGGRGSISSIQTFQNTTCTPPAPPQDCNSFNGTGITFFDNQNCTGANTAFSSAGFRNMPDVGFNDRARSVHVKAGWSARIYEHNDKGGATRCVTGHMWNFAIDRYDNNGPFIHDGTTGTISSVEVFQNTTCTPPAPPQDCSNFAGTGVTLFDNVNCTGTYSPFTSAGTWNMSTSFNDKARSVQVKSGWSIKVYADANKSGQSRCLTGNMSNFALDKYDDGVTYIHNGTTGTISSVEVFQNGTCTPPAPPQNCDTFDNGMPITFFLEMDCAGASKSSYGVAGKFNLSTGFNDKTRSVQVKSGWSVRMYSDANQSGYSRCTSVSAWNFAIDRYDNNGPFLHDGTNGTVSSIEIFQNSTCTPPAPPQDCNNFAGTGITFFDNMNCTGANAAFSSPGVRNMPDHGFNDRARSVHVKPGWSARIYEHDNKGGASRCITGHMWNFAIDKYDDGVTYIHNGTVGTISSVEVFQSTTCPVAPPPSACDTFAPAGINLFSGTQCTGSVNKTATQNFKNLSTPGFDNLTKSIHVQSGWSVKVYAGLNRKGANKCITATTKDLTGMTYSNGAQIISSGVSTISSIDTYANSTCTSVCASYTATGITLFSYSQCVGTKKLFTSTGLKNMSSYTFDNKTMSIYVQPGWSVRIYDGANKTGSNRCVIGTMWNLAVDKYSNGTNIVVNGVSTVSSITVHNNNSCL